MSASPARTRNVSSPSAVRKSETLRTPPAVPEQLLLVAVGDLDARARSRRRAGPRPCSGNQCRLAITSSTPCSASSRDELLDDRDVADRDDRLGDLVGDRPQPRAEARRHDHRAHAQTVGAAAYGRPSRSLRFSITATGVGSTPRARGELEREQVAEHHGPEQALGAGLALGLDADHVVGVARRSARRSARPADARAGAGRRPRGRRRCRRPSAAHLPSRRSRCGPSRGAGGRRPEAWRSR